MTVKKFLFGVEASDPMSIALAVSVLAVAALVAALVPMLGAAKADPLTVLRSE
jgi:ABC-type antimicrobial peptide transport system permease subunit